jgi:hypothetical protein
VAIDYRAGDFVAAVRRITSGRKGGAGVDAAFDAIGGAHFSRSFASLANGGLLVGYGSQAMAVGHEGLLAAGLGLARLKVWSRLTFLFGGRRAVWYSITDRRVTHPEEFKTDMAPCSICCARAPSIPSLSTDYRSRLRGRSITELMPAVSAGRSCYHLGPSRNEIVAF